jgi:hypothetical protein
MTKKDQEKYIKTFKDYRKSVTSSKESAKKFMVESGIITKSGKLSSDYK